MPPMKKAAKKGRPVKKYGRRDFTVSIKLTAEEKERFERAADSARMGLSDFVREAVDAAARKQLGEP